MANSARVSVFAVTSCVVFIVTTLEVAPVVGQGIEFEFIVGDIKGPVELPWLWVPLSLFHVFMALRLYAHAWAIDESDVLSRALLGSKKLRLMEWLLRGAWVALVSYLPTTLGKVAAGDWGFVGDSAEAYYVLVFGLVGIWDGMMYRHVRNAEVQFAFVRRHFAGVGALKKWWLGIDCFLFMSALVLAVTNLAWSGAFENWKPFIFMLFLSVSSAVCLVQLWFWVPEIRASLRGPDGEVSDLVV